MTHELAARIVESDTAEQEADRIVELYETIESLEAELRRCRAETLRECEQNAREELEEWVRLDVNAHRRDMGPQAAAILTLAEQYCRMADEAEGNDEKDN